MNKLIPLIALIIACDDTSSREAFYDECFSEEKANENILLVQQGQIVCPNLDEVSANCALSDEDYETDSETCEITATADCAPGYRYHVVMRENAVKLSIVSPDFDCSTNGFEPYTNY